MGFSRIALTSWRWIAALLVVVMASISACSEQKSQGYEPLVLRIGVLPDEDEAVLGRRFSPLGGYLAAQLDRPYELVVPKDYAELVDRFSAGEFDLAYFGGLTFLQAQQRVAAIPLVMRDIDAHFSSYFLVHADAPNSGWDGLAGARFGFGSALSTSGHLMPRFFLNQKGIDPDTHFSETRFSGAHDKTAKWVADGVVDIGAANAYIVDEMLQDGRLDPSQIRVFWETPPYADYVWAVPAGLDDEFRQTLLNTFLSLSPANPEHQSILDAMDAGGFLPASVEDFDSLADTARKLGLLEPGGDK